MEVYISYQIEFANEEIKTIINIMPKLSTDRFLIMRKEL